MNDACLICEWMEPRPNLRAGECAGLPGQWWKRRGITNEVKPMPLTLDALWEVEERLTGAQVEAYLMALVGCTTDIAVIARAVHATAEQKIKALADVIRSGKNSTSDTPSFPPPNKQEPSL